MRQHINLYVNNFSLDLGTEGLQAVEKLTHIIINVSVKLHAFATTINTKHASANIFSSLQSFFEVLNAQKKFS
jgi:hypothetical protein